MEVLCLSGGLENFGICAGYIKMFYYLCKAKRSGAPKPYVMTIN